jgi:hypothetical protein
MTWAFTDPPNFVAYSTRAVMERGEPILLVAHEADDGAWQFIGPTADPADLVVICLEHAVTHDPSVSELADLPFGWAAERDSTAGPWRRFLLAPDSDAL